MPWPNVQRAGTTVGIEVAPPPELVGLEEAPSTSCRCRWTSCSTSRRRRHIGSGLRPSVKVIAPLGERVYRASQRRRGCVLAHCDAVGGHRAGRARSRRRDRPRRRGCGAAGDDGNRPRHAADHRQVEREDRPDGARADAASKAAAPAPTPATGRAENVIAPQGVGPQATPMDGVVIAPPPVNEEAAEGQAENVISSQGIGPQAPIDPKLRGFFPVPYTKAMIRFNAKPRVDFTYDTENPGDDDRFVPAKIPVSSATPTRAADRSSTPTARARRLIIDVRAPEMAGQPALLLPERFLRLGQRRVQLPAPAALRQHLQRHRRPDVQPVRGSRHLARYGRLRRSELDDLRSLSAGAVQARSRRGLERQRRTDGIQHAGLGLRRRAGERRGPRAGLRLQPARRVGGPRPHTVQHRLPRPQRQGPDVR